MTVFSQQSEQDAILASVAEVGKFLDIGAYHATDLSNVRALYERGWSGVLVEPSPGPARSLVEAYGNDERISVVCAAVAAEMGLVRMWASNGPYSTMRWEQHDQWVNEAGFVGQFWVPTVTIEFLINQFGPFNFVNIDTEGTSVDILHRLLQTPMDPKCICCEHDGQIIQCVKIAEAKGYHVVDENGCNIIFAR